MANKRVNRTAIRKRLMGTNERMGLLPSAALYVMLIAVAFVYLYPLLSMLVISVESLEDLVDTSVKWIPHSVNLQNYQQAMEVMGFRDHLVDTLLVVLLPALAQTLSCALSGYGLARFRFKGKGCIMALILLTFVVPFQALMVPTYMLYSDYGILGSISTLVLPAAGSQGLRAAIFILIYKAFFEQTPPSLDEAARVDGAGEAHVFFRIGLPLGLPAMLTTFLFSFVWYWNDTYMFNLFIGNAVRQGQRPLSTLMAELQRFESSYSDFMEEAMGSAAQAAAAGVDVQNEAITMAGTLLTILIPLIIYFLLQRYFVEAIDRSGITGE